MDKTPIATLEQQVEELLRVSRRLREENLLLKAQQSAWMTERAQLVEKTETAKKRIAEMVGRLKAIESTS